MEVVEREFWWPGMREDVRKWCARCEQCAGDRARPGLSAWARTELFSRPFRVLQFDTVEATTQHSGEGDYKYILTCSDCFSRWPWLIPITNKDATTIADGLMIHVFLGIASFPVVVRSDNAKEFTGEVIEAMNRLLEIQHVTGSAYHPQSQGMVESMHRTMNSVVRALATDHPDDWVARLPYAQSVMRNLPLKALGGRSPYEVVTGLRPKYPESLRAGHMVESLDVDTYANRCQIFFKETYAEVDRIRADAAEDIEGSGAGGVHAELEVGNIVLLRKPFDSKATVPKRFQPKVYPYPYRIKRAIGRQTFTLESLIADDKPLPFIQPVHAERLVLLDMPELGLDPDQKRRLDLHEPTTDTWDPFHVERFSLDGRVKIRSIDRPMLVEWIDLSTRRYRWRV